MMDVLKRILVIAMLMTLAACGGSDGGGNDGGTTTPPPTQNPDPGGQDDDDPDDGDGDNPPVDEKPSYSVSQLATLEGQVNLDLVALQRINQSALRTFSRLSQEPTGSVTDFQINSTASGKSAGNESGLWLVPSEANLAIGADERSANQADQESGDDQSARPPKVKPIPVTVDAEGRFMVQVPGDEGYTLLVIDPEKGNGARIDDIDLAAGDTVEQDVTEEHLVGVGSVELRVTVGEAREPLAEAVVTLLDLDLSLQTGPDGLAEFTDLPAGRYTAYVKAEGYAGRMVPFVALANEAVQLADTQLMAAPGSLMGQVEAPELSSPANIPVFVRSPHGGYHAALTSVGGTFEIPALPAGEGYSVVIAAPDHDPVKLDGVDIRSGETTTLSTQTLATNPTVGSIIGHALFQGRERHAGILVSVEGTDKEAVTARDGTFVLKGLEPGRYTLNLTHANHDDKTLEVDILAGVHTELSEQWLDSLNGAISGQVLDNDGNAVGEATIILLGLGQTTVSDGQGQFLFDQVPVGQYTIQITRGGYQSTSKTVTIAADKTQTLTEADAPVLTPYRLEGMISLGSDVVDLGGSLVTLAGSGQSVQTDSDGRFVFKGVVPGNYQLQVSRDGYQAHQQALTLPEGEPDYALPYTIDLTRAYGTVKGKVTLEGRDNHSGIVVSVQNTAYSTTTDAAGFWSMTLPEGQYDSALQYSRAGYETASESGPIAIEAEAELLKEALALVRETGRVTGVVLDGAGNPLSGAVVEVQGTGQTALTNDVGEFTLDSVPTGEYQVNVQHSGYKGQTEAVVIRPNADLALSEGALSLQAYRFSGEVSLGSSAQDHSGAIVSLVGNGATHTAQTEGGGNFYFEGVEPGNFQLQVSRDGYQSYRQALTLPEDETNYVLPYVIDLTRAYGTVEGRVTLEGRDDHSGIVINVQDTAYSTTTDAAGYWSMTLPEGEYPGSLQYSYAGYGAQHISGPVVIAAESELNQESAVLLRESGRLGGLVVDASSAPLAGVTLEVRGAGLTVQSNEYGEFFLENVPTGEHEVTLRRDGYVAVQETVVIESGVETALSEAAVVLQAYRFSGEVVLGSDASDHGGVLITLVGNGGTYTSQSDVQGVFSFEGVEPGNYQLQVSREGYQPHRQALTLPEGEPDYALPYTIDLTRAYGTVKGQVTLEGRDNHSGIVVSVQNTAYSTTTDAAGFWSMTLPEGQYDSALQYSRAGYATASEAGPIAIEAEAELLKEALALVRETGSLAGQVVGADSTPLAGATIEVQGTGLTSLTDETGAFNLESVPTGDYLVNIRQPGYQTVTETAVIEAGGETLLSDAAVALQAYRFAGSLSLGDNVQDHSGVVLTLVGNGVTVTSQSDSNGEFAFEGVVPGNYQLQARRDNYGSVQTLLSIPSDSLAYELPYTLMLDPVRGTLQGIARLEGQTDHSGIWVSLVGRNASTTTDSTGRWTLEAPVGNYPEGVRYERNHYATVLDSANTITLTESGTHTVADALLEQASASISGEVSVVGVQDPTTAVVEIVGVSGAADGVSNTINPNADGSYHIPNLPLGEYVIEIRYESGEHETITLPLDLTEGQTYVELDPVALRQSYLTINGGAEYTNNPAVSLAIGNTEAAEMQLVVNGQEQTRTEFANGADVTLSGGDGEQSVVARFWDSDGNALPEVTDQIILDTTLVASSFEATGASSLGDTLVLRLNIGESGAEAVASLPGVFTNMKLFDDGTQGDTSANDGIYERRVTIQQPVDLESVVSANVVDRAGNTLAVDSDQTVALQTAPSVQALRVSSNITDGTMTISFNTNEPANTSLTYGYALNDQPETEVVSSTLAGSHTVTLTGLSANELTYFTITATDAAGNSTEHAGRGKLAPPTPDNFNIQPGAGEIGLIWTEVTTPGTVGYNLYRKEAGDSFVRVNTDGPITTRYYRDGNVANDVEYAYRLAAVDVDGNESIQSDSIAATPSEALAGPTDVGTGVITNDEIWLASRSPYRVVGNVRVREDSDLVLLPGTEVDLVGNDRFMLVDGELFGYGAEEQRVVIQTIEYDQDVAGSIRFPEAEGGYAYLDYASILNINIYRNYSSDHDRERNPAPVHIRRSIVEIEGLRKVPDFQVSELDHSSFTVTSPDGGHYYSGRGIRILSSTGVEFNSAYNNAAYGVSYADVELNFVSDSLFMSGEYRIEEANTSRFEGVTIRDPEITYEDRIKITGSELVSSRVIARDRDDSQIVMSFNSMTDDVKLEANNYDVRRNYWGTLDVNDIAARTGYIRKDGNFMYPIISAPDLRTADYDGDGVPDYRDWDVDGDGYSELQEDLMSDQAFNLVYDPLDDQSYPSEAKDADMDGIPDDQDDDIDNDGLANNEEVSQGTDPYMSDSDGDDVRDGLEVAASYDPLDESVYPLTGEHRNLVIDGRNVNSDGEVMVIADERHSRVVRLTDVSVDPGVTLRVDSESETIISGDIQGTRNDPVKVRSTGVGTGYLRFENVDADYINLRVSVGLEVSRESIVSFSDVSALDLNLYGGKVESSYISLSSTLNASKGVVDSCYVTGDVSFHGGEVSKSYLVNDRMYSAKTSEVYAESYTGGDYSISGSIVENSIIKAARSSSLVAKLYRSDITMHSSAYHDEWLFFEESAIIGSDGGSLYSGLGSPEDVDGDGNLDTEFTLNGLTYRVDGISRPASSRYYPDWISDPSVKQYFWNPDNVGALWDPLNPDVFPEP